MNCPAWLTPGGVFVSHDPIRQAGHAKRHCISPAPPTPRRRSERTAWLKSAYAGTGTASSANDGDGSGGRLKEDHGPASGARPHGREDVYDREAHARGADRSAAELIVKYGQVRKVRANNAALEYLIVSRGGPIPLKHFGAYQTRKGVSAAPWRNRKIYRGAFILGRSAAMCSGVLRRSVSRSESRGPERTKGDGEGRDGGSVPSHRVRAPARTCRARDQSPNERCRQLSAELRSTAYRTARPPGGELARVPPWPPAPHAARRRPGVSVFLGFEKVEFRFRIEPHNVGKMSRNT